MSYNILLNPVFEPHINRNNALPYIYHTDLTCGKRIANYHENLELLYFLDGCGTVQINDTIYELPRHYYDNLDDFTLLTDFFMGTYEMYYGLNVTEEMFQ